MPKPGLIVGYRYALRSRLGRGGHGEVWEAEDRIGGGLVAVKLLRDGRQEAPSRLGSEVSILRLHQIPGVVRLLDESAGEPLPFIVLELVRGEPFPGRGRLRDWSRLGETVIALVEILARLHAEGVVHQDLKPANVLVDAVGKPTILDFGIAADRRLETLRDDGYVMGTVPYMAPERLLGQPVTPRADLYSLGVLLFEALTGRLPHEAEDTRDLVRECARAPSPPVRQIAPEAPPAVAGLVDLLLSKDPARRPGSALTVLGMLRGHPRAERADELLFRLGGDEVIDRVLGRVRAGRRVDLVGPRRTGRSRCLAEVKAAIERGGGRVALLRPARCAFGSLMPLAGSLRDQWTARLAEVADFAAARVRAALAEGVVVLADDVDRMDEYSALVLERCCDAGPIVRVLEETNACPHDEGTIRITPLDVSALAPLFAGPERLFHLPSQAARILHARTFGVQARVVEEIHRWLRAGAVAWGGSELVVARDLLEQLDASAAPRAMEDDLRDVGEPFSASLEELLAWSSLAWPDGSPELLSACAGRPVWEIEAHLEYLVRRGAARRHPDGRVEPLSSPSADRAFSLARRRYEHAAIAAALPSGTPRRFFHLAAALDAEPAEASVTALAEEAVTLARRLADSGTGDLGHATIALQEALFQIRCAPVEASLDLQRAEERALAALVDLALADGTERAVGRAQYELGRARSQSDLIGQIRQLVEGALAFMAGGDRALRLLDTTPPFADLDLERRRQALRARASRRCSPAVEDETLRDIESWAAGQSDPVTQARRSAWLGWWHYRRGRYAEAARLHRAAAIAEPSRSGRVLALVACASALMETLDARDLDEAQERAEEALSLARVVGSPYIEARAEWIRRATLHRSGADVDPDLELVEAASRLRLRDVEAAICLVEAVFAHRRGSRDAARDLAIKAAGLWKFVNDPWPRMLARCLALAAGGEAESPDEVNHLFERARACPVRGLGIQAIGLLARAPGSPSPAWRESAPPLAATIAPTAWRRRMDVLSVDEALDALRDGAPGSSP
ncbi:serine/threonine protein kinase [Minicystis rosea]|nr:serine/threonine protein kinase [Minicystis rosea]